MNYSASGKVQPHPKLNGTDIAGFFALGASAAFERHALILGEALEAICLDVLEVGEQVRAAAVRRDKAKALGVVKPFDCAGLSAHVFFLGKN